MRRWAICRTLTSEMPAESRFDSEVADLYDEIFVSVDDGTVELLASLAAGGNALELGIGTGRIALPLMERGVAVEGVDNSSAMVAKLRAKPGGSQIAVHDQSFDWLSIDRRFALVYVAFNTFFDLHTQDQQVCCFQSVAKHLASTGVFVLEAFVPDLTRYGSDLQNKTVERQGDGYQIVFASVDPVRQAIEAEITVAVTTGMRSFPVTLRYAWPAELDLMARIAGMKLKERWGSWIRAPYTGVGKHMSVYELAH